MEKSYTGTGNVLMPLKDSETYVISGKTDLEPTHRLGSMMSAIEKWLKEEKSFEITGAGILFSLIFFILGLSLFLKLRKSDDVMYFQKQRFRMVALMQIEDKGNKIWVPAYKEY